MITTKEEVKAFLQITGTTQDDLIDSLIPIVQDYALNYCNTNFPIKNKYRRATTIAFVEGSPATITDSDELFVDAKFTANMHVLVSGSIDNDKIVEVDTVAAGTLTLKSGETLVDEDAGEDVFLQKVVFPPALKLTVAKMIGFNLEKNVSKGKKSEKVGSYSVTYDNNYPASIMKELSAFRKVAF